MKTIHLSEEQLQAFADGQPNEISSELQTHLQTCAQCRLAAEQYRLTYMALVSMPQDHFDFDLSAQVLAALPESPPTPVWQEISLIAFIAAAILLVFILIIIGLKVLLTGQTPLALSLTLTAAAAIAISQGIGLSDSYQRKMARIDLY